jgi:predicted transposase YbfD/YdcC
VSAWAEEQRLVLGQKKADEKSNEKTAIPELLEELDLQGALVSIDATTANKLVRNHWGIENKLHWMMDVVFSEDRSRTRKGNAPENMATLRKVALQLLNQQTDKQSIKSRRKIAGWNNQYLLQLIQNLRF